MTAAPAGQSKAAEENAPAPKPDDPSVNEAPEQKVPEPAGPNDPVEAGVVEVLTKAKTDKEKGTADPSGNVVKRTRTTKSASPAKSKDPFTSVDLSKLPIAIAVGQITLSIEEYAGRAVAALSLRGWVGDAPLKVLASDIAEIEQAFAELRKQLS